MSEKDDINIELDGCLLIALFVFLAVLGFALGWLFGGVFF